MIYQVDKETFMQHSELFDGVKIINSFGCIHIITDDSYYCDICTMLGFNHVKPERAFSLTKINKTLVDACLPYISQNLVVYCSFIVEQYERITVSDIISATEKSVVTSDTNTYTANSPFFDIAHYIVDNIVGATSYHKIKLKGIDIDADFINGLCEYYSNDYHLVAFELSHWCNKISRIGSAFELSYIPDTKLAKGKDILTDLEQQLVTLKKKFLYAAYN